jgi:hypothetical protein
MKNGALEDYMVHLLSPIWAFLHLSPFHVFPDIGDNVSTWVLCWI